MLLTIVSITSMAVMVRIFANPLSNVFQKQLTRQSVDPLFITGATYAVLTLGMLVFWRQLPFSGLSATFWYSMITAGVLAAVGNVLLIKALEIGDLSVLGPINAYKAVIGLLIGGFVLHELPNGWGVLGLALIVGGSYLVLAQPGERSFSWRVMVEPAVRLRLLALVFSATDGVLLKKAILLSSPTTAFFYWCGFGFVSTAVWIGAHQRTRIQVQLARLQTQKLVFLALVLAVGITQLTSNVALAGMPVGYALALFQLSAVLSVLLGYRFFQERNIARKLVGAGVMAVGAALITLLG